MSRALTFTGLLALQAAALAKADRGGGKGDDDGRDFGDNGNHFGLFRPEPRTFCVGNSSWIDLDMPSEIEEPKEPSDDDFSEDSDGDDSESDFDDTDDEDNTDTDGEDNTDPEDGDSDGGSGSGGDGDSDGDGNGDSDGDGDGNGDGDDKRKGKGKSKRVIQVEDGRDGEGDADGEGSGDGQGNGDADDEETDDESDKDDSDGDSDAEDEDDKNERKRLKKAFTVLKTVRFFCAEDLREQCGLGKADRPSCPEIILDQCASCFPNPPMVNRTCVCECEKANEDVAKCTKGGPDGPDSDDEDNSDSEDNDSRSLRSLSSLLRARGQGHYGHALGSLMRRIANCLTSNSTVLTDTCSTALTYKQDGEDAGTIDTVLGEAASSFDNSESAASTPADQPADGGAPVGAIAGALVGAAVVGAAAVALNRRRQAGAGSVPTATAVASVGDDVEEAEAKPVEN